MIEYNIDAQGIATLTIDMPGRAMNVIDWGLVEALTAQVERIAADPAVTGVVLTSGKSSFVAGADLAIMKDFVREGVTPRHAADLIATIGNVLRRLETMGKPVVGASPGTAMGGGLELLLACHYRVAADTPGALYGLPEVTLGLLPGAGGTQRLPRMIGIVKALPLMVEGTPLSTAEAQALGILDEVVPASELIASAKRALTEGRVNATAPWDRKGFRIPGGDSNQPALNDFFSGTNGRIFGRTQCLHPAPKAIVSCVYEGSRLPMNRALHIEQMYFAQLVQGSVAQGLIRTMFFARQAADKLVRRPPGVPKAKVVRLGVIGVGSMAQDIAQASVQVGIQVTRIDHDLSPEHGLSADDQAALNGCDLVIEANLWPTRFIGLNFCSPQASGALVEIAVTPATAPATLALAMDCVRQLRRTPIVVRGARGFYTARGVNAYLSEGLQLLFEGVHPAEIDNAAMAVGMAVGPIALADEMGLDVLQNLRQDIRAADAGIDHSAVAFDTSDALIDAFHAAARQGRQSGGGVYDYIEGRCLSWPGLATLVARVSGMVAPSLKPQISQADIAERLLAVQVLTAVDAFLQDIVTDPGEADLGAVLGWSFPSHLGGPLGAIDSEGIPQFVDRMTVLAHRLGPRFAPSLLLREHALAKRRFHLN